MEENYTKDYAPQHGAPETPQEHPAQPATPQSAGRGAAEFTPEARAYLAGAAKWARFISIVGFVGMGLGVLLILAIFTMTSMDSMAGVTGMANVFGVIGMQLYFAFILLLLLVYFFPLHMLYQFATRAQRGLAYNDTGLLTGSFRFMRDYWRFMGVLVIVMLVLYALILIGAMVAGAVAAMAV